MTSCSRACADVHGRACARLSDDLPEYQLFAVADDVFPDPGRYVIPRGLDVVQIDRGRDVGRYWEPNVWMITEL